MKKIIISLLSLIVLLTTSVVGYAEVLKVLASYAKFPKTIDAKIKHIAIETVSTIDGLLNAKISVDFGSHTTSTAKARIKYYVNGDTSTTDQKPTEEGIKILNNEEFFIALPKLSLTDEQFLDYQIIVDFYNAQGTLENTIYFPSNTDPTSYQHSVFVSSITKSITASTDDVVEFNSGNQQYGNTKLQITAGTLSSDSQLSIKQLPADSSGGSSAEQMLTKYEISSVPEVEISSESPIKATFFYGTDSVSTEFVLKYKKDENSDWENVVISEKDLANKTVTANITKFGYYAVFEISKAEDKNYRPRKRVVVKGRDVFKFNGLKEGDSVKIYTTMGKKIKEIRSGDSEGFKWNGQKDNGDWAKSGIYIYQIKVNGKLISGTIAFVK